MARSLRRFGNRRKFGNTWTVYKGIKYHSKLEAAYAKYLDEQKKKKKIKSWDRQIRVDLCVSGIHICSVIVDFLVKHLDDSVEYVEIKGMETPVYRIKYKLLKALYPYINYTVLKTKQLKLMGITT